MCESRVRLQGELAPVLEEFHGELGKQFKTAKAQMLWAAMSSCWPDLLWIKSDLKLLWSHVIWLMEKSDNSVLWHAVLPVSMQ
jgi:hypothetical protein